MWLGFGDTAMLQANQKPGVFVPKIARCLAGSERIDGETETFVVGTLRSNHRNNSNPMTEARQLVVAPTLRASYERPGGGPPIAPALHGYGHGAQGQHNDDAAKMGLVRRLTPLECERLQGFPDGWTAPTGKEKDSPRYRALGNAVAVPVVEWIARRLIRRSPPNAPAPEADSRGGV
jgi:site-specific DNA-cytosine methylase